MDELKLFRKRVGETVRKLRKTSGLSQEKLAEMADMSTTYFGEIERGERNCSIDSIKKISKGLGIRMETLFQMAEDEGKEEGKDDAFLSSEAKIISQVKDKEGWKLLILVSAKEKETYEGT